MERCFAFMGVKEERITWSRVNGWTLPPHPLQIITWLFIMLFAIFHYFCFIPMLHSSWQVALYIVPGVSLLVLVVSLVVVSSIDPADPSVLKTRYPKKPFDITQHEHVIENNHCHICQVDVQPKTEHCSQCNKCVSDFDHHCIWLNTCIGDRNYRWFLASLSSAIIYLSMMVAESLVLWISYYTDQTDRKILQPYRDLAASQSHKEAVFLIFYKSVSHTGWLVMLGVYFVFGVFALCNVVPLFGCHLHLIYQNVRRKQEDAGMSSGSDRNRVMPLMSVMSSNDQEEGNSSIRLSIVEDDQEAENPLPTVQESNDSCTPSVTGVLSTEPLTAVQS